MDKPLTLAVVLAIVLYVALGIRLHRSKKARLITLLSKLQGRHITVGCVFSGRGGPVDEVEGVVDGIRDGHWLHLEPVLVVRVLGGRREIRQPDTGGMSILLSQIMFVEIDGRRAFS